MHNSDVVGGGVWTRCLCCVTCLGSAIAGTTELSLFLEY